jgi:hypothetical protein
VGIIKMGILKGEFFFLVVKEINYCVLLDFKSKEYPGKDCILTYLLTPWSRVLLEKLTSKLCS